MGSQCGWEAGLTIGSLEQWLWSGHSADTQPDMSFVMYWCPPYRCLFQKHSFVLISCWEKGEAATFPHVGLVGETSLTK